MGKLIYSSLSSLDGYIADEVGNFDWAVPDEEVLDFINDLMRPVGTYLYGRRMYELMIGWETDPSAAAQSPRSRDFAEIWQSTDKVVYSTTLESVSTSRTRLESSFDPEAIRRLKTSTSHDIVTGGSNLAAQAIEADLIDEYHLIVAPVSVGGGKPVFPPSVHVKLELMDERRFEGGMVYLRYRSRM